MPTSLPTIGRRRFYVVRAGLPVRYLIEGETLEGRRMLTIRYLFGPWRLLVTGTRDQLEARRERYLTRITTAPRRAVR